MKRFGGVLLCAVTIGGFIAAVIKEYSFDDSGPMVGLSALTGLAAGVLFSKGLSIIKKNPPKKKKG